MPELSVPDCLNQRYVLLDEIIKDLTGVRREPSDSAHDKIYRHRDDNIWENPCSNQMEGVYIDKFVGTRSSPVTFPQSTRHIAYHFSNEKETTKSCCNKSYANKKTVFPKPGGCKCSSLRNSPEALVGSSNQRCKEYTEPKSGIRCAVNDAQPLSKVLCNLKEAISFDKKCNFKVKELVQTQKDLQNQIAHLENKERNGIIILKKADNMWSEMENQYKKKVAAYQERQKSLLKEIKTVEDSTKKWRKNKKDLEVQIQHLGKCQDEIKEQTNQKTNDTKTVNIEIENLKKRIEGNKKQLESSKKSMVTKKQASDKITANINAEISKISKIISEEQNAKYAKESDGAKEIENARRDLQGMSKVLLQRKLQKEDLLSEKAILLQELDLVKQNYDNCQEKCQQKENVIDEEIKILKKEIAQYKAKCTQCHQTTDSDDIRKFCSDCPRCQKERHCLYENEHCAVDHTMDCVCMSVKQKFMDNVFENMYTVLERKSKSDAGKAVAEAVLNCLKRSKNGKLDADTRSLLQNFILTTVKKTLNLTIIGGAVKTRCEMDPESYKQLMLCLKDVKVTKSQVPKEDKATPTRKDPCRRWGGPNDCNCPKGPKNCVCTKKALPPPHDPTSCELDEEDLVASDKDTIRSLHHKNCRLDDNMRAAQCVLGPDALAVTPEDGTVHMIAEVDELIICTCSETPMKPCPCHGDINYLKSENYNLEICNEDTCTNDDVPQIINIMKSAATEDIHCDKNENTIIDEKHKNIRKQSHIANKVRSHSKIGSMPKLSQGPFKSKVKIIINGDNSPTGSQYTQLTETNSGQIVMLLQKHIAKQIKTKKDTCISVYLNKTDSRQLILHIDTKNTSVTKTRKAFIKLTPSGTRLLDMHKNVMNRLKDTINPNISHYVTYSNKTCDCGLSSLIKVTSVIEKECAGYYIMEKFIQKRDARNIFFQVTVSGIEKVPIELPAVLECTPSDNFIIVLEREFEKHYKNKIKAFLHDSVECLVALNKISDQIYNIELNTQNDIPNENLNGLLVKSSSGTIKVLVNGPLFKNMMNDKISNRSSLDSTKAFKDLVTGLPFRQQNIKSSHFAATSSESCDENESLNSKGCATVPETASDNYDII